MSNRQHYETANQAYERHSESSEKVYERHLKNRIQQLSGRTDKRGVEELLHCRRKLAGMVAKQ